MSDSGARRRIAAAAAGWLLPLTSQLMSSWRFPLHAVRKRSVQPAIRRDLLERSHARQIVSIFLLI